MRIKVQTRNASGLMQDIVLDPGQKHMIALDFTPRDLEHIAKRSFIFGAKRVHVGGVPMRVKTRVALNGKHVDIVIDRTAGDWIAIELTADDITRLTSMGVGQSIRKIVYAGPKPKPQQTADVEKFKMDWPPCAKADENMDYERGVPLSIATHPVLLGEFIKWSLDWPLNFHNSDRAPAPRLVLADGKTVDGKDG